MTLRLTDHGEDRTMTLAQLEAAISSGQAPARTTQTASYQTPTVSPTVYFTALLTNGSVLTARTTSGVTLANGLYRYAQNVTGLTDFIAVWDEGDVNDYTSEWIVVDT